MESKNNIENFEKFLRDKTDEFRMYPSKRVWYSIYNNMHPGNRLPSIAMSIVLICSLLLVGYLNTSNSHGLASDSPDKAQALAATQVSSAEQKNQQNLPAVQPLQMASNTAGADAGKIHLRQPAAAQRPAGIATTPRTNSFVQQTSSAANSNGSSILPAQQPSAGTLTINDNQVAAAELPANTALAVLENKPIIRFFDEMNTVTSGNPAPANISVNAAAEEYATGKKEQAEQDIATGRISEEIASTEKTAKNTVNAAAANQPAVKSKTMSPADKAWIDNFALYNRPVPKKWAGKVNMQAYLTPSVVYRTLHNNAADKTGGNIGNASFNNARVDDVVVQKPSFGLETGLSFQYDLLKFLRLKAGVQLNYTRYNSHAFENHHPIASSIIMTSDNGASAYEVFSTTPYSNSYGLTPVKLRNETYQFSIPLGADLKLLSLDKFSWYAGATIQPTFVVFGNTYLISADRRTYIADKSMLNHFNLNAGFETYVSLKTDKGYTWQIGPQFRTQLFSTNSKFYSVEERLMNFGVKIGITKRL